MNETATRERCTDAPSRELWRSIPFDLMVSVAAIILAAGLKLAGVLP